MYDLKIDFQSETGFNQMLLQALDSVCFALASLALEFKFFFVLSSWLIYIVITLNFGVWISKLN